MNDTLKPRLEPAQVRQTRCKPWKRKRRRPKKKKETWKAERRQLYEQEAGEEIGKGGTCSCSTDVSSEVLAAELSSRRRASLDDADRAGSRLEANEKQKYKITVYYILGGALQYFNLFAFRCHHRRNLFKSMEVIAIFKHAAPTESRNSIY